MPLPDSFWGKPQPPVMVFRGVFTISHALVLAEGSPTEVRFSRPGLNGLKEAFEDGSLIVLVLEGVTDPNGMPWSDPARQEHVLRAVEDIYVNERSEQHSLYVCQGDAYWVVVQGRGG